VRLSLEGLLSEGMCRDACACSEHSVTHTLIRGTRPKLMN